MGNIACPKYCPNRSVSPNCHNPDICENWKRYLEKQAKIKLAIKKEREMLYRKPGEIKKRAKNLRKHQKNTARTIFLRYNGVLALIYIFGGQNYVKRRIDSFRTDPC